MESPGGGRRGGGEDEEGGGGGGGRREREEGGANFSFFSHAKQNCTDILVETVPLVRPSSAPKSQSDSVHNGEALSKKPSNVRIGYLPTMPSFKHLQQSRTRLKSAPPLLREFLLGRPNPRQILYSAPHFIPRKSPTEHCIYMTLIALHQSESDSSLSLFSFHCSMICSARRSHLSLEK